jgi:phosphatidylglycerophosphate synthase
MDDWRIGAKQLIVPAAKLLIKLRVGPSFLTYAGIVLALVSGLMYARSAFALGGIFLALSGISDSLDGEVARRSRKRSDFGAILDSLSDRFVEFFIFFGLMIHYRSDAWVLIVLYFSLFFSIMVSYLRARGEGLGVSVKAGPMDRTVRLIFLFVISFLGSNLFSNLMFVFLILTFVTVVRRFVQLYNSFKSP